MVSSVFQGVDDLMIREQLDFIKRCWLQLAMLLGVTYLLMTLILVFGREVYDDGLKSRTAERHQYLLDLAESQIHEFILRITQDIQQLSILPSVSEYLALPNAVNRRTLEETFAATSHIYGRYDQIRLLDLKGQELIRVNYHAGGPVAVPQSLLQNKADRYYTREGMQLNPGEFYLSPLDLNVENGEIEKPLKPVIRAVNLLRNSSGKPQALLILNYRAGDFLNNFRALFSHGGRGMLINNDGYWLSNHERMNEWGWQLGQPDKQISQWNPELWLKIQDSKFGRFDSESEMVSFRTIQPSSFDKLVDGRFASSSGLKQDVKIQSWYALVQSTRDQWLEDAFYHHPAVKLFIFSLYLATFALIWLFLKHKADKKLNAEQQARYTSELEDLYYNAPIGYLTIDAETRITNANRKILEYLQYGREDLLGHRLTDILSPDSHKELMAAITTRHSGELRMEARCKDGSWLPVNSAISSKFDGTALTMSRCSVQDISLQMELEQRLRNLANTDALTGAYNRRYTEILFLEALEHLADGDLGGELSILVLDIDHFKAINDNYGHGAGDEVLVAFTKLCLQCIGSKGHFSRFGGEEFLVLMPQSDSAQAVRLAEKIRQETEKLVVETSDRREVRFTVSIGIAVYQHSSHENLDQLIHRADEKLYEAKRSGRNRVVG
ncbi:sensor domain-containing diguanylate cyclase [Oceanospirillum sanctuarii]|uniref:sensor domain-containing diguanylate cyclase n=1 Tax=Oceanospirillum sanctuarii TaxID=1434821 RepID=UPI000A38BAAA|nr:diguanylate cyclase [Oceanospirillum sanctuarii]